MSKRSKPIFSDHKSKKPQIIFTLIVIVAIAVAAIYLYHTNKFQKTLR